MLDTEKLTNETQNDIYDDFSLESILAEYSDYDPELAAQGDTASRSKQIVYEALGETGFSGGVESSSPEAEETVGAYAAEGPAEGEPEPYREARKYTGRLRRGFRRFGHRGEEPEPVSEPAPEPEPDFVHDDAVAGEPDFGEDDDVKVYRPASRFTPPEGDEDVKLYGAAPKRDIDSVVAEAERRSAKWSRRAEPGFTSHDADFSRGDYPADFRVDYTDFDTDAFSESDSGSFDEYGGDVREYGFDSDEGERFAAPDSENTPRRDHGRAPRARPLLGFLAALGVRMQRAQTAGEAVTLEDAEELGAELPPKKAAKYYAGSANSLRLRTRLAILPLAALLWVSLGLPAFGALGSDLKVTSLACLVMQLTVAMLGLDVFTSGVMSLVRGRPGMWSLVAIANIAAALDAAVAYAVGTAGWGYPMCAAAALGMFFALWGATLEARALRFSCKAQELADDPLIVTAEGGVEGREGTVLLKSRRDTAGWLHRCEEPDGAENVFSAAATWLLLAAFILAAAATAISGQWTYFFRIFAAAACAAAPAGAFVACPLPYFLLAVRAFRKGAAVAGWPGMRDIGRAMGMVVTDGDLFPGDSVKIKTIRILDGADPERVIADAGSVIVASGSGLSPVFADLMERNGYALRRVEDFCCHEGGGLTALIAGEEVLCGSAGFMRLMGVLVPQKLADKTSVFIAVGGTLSGIFNMEYTAYSSVAKALAGCLKSRRAPIFAVRDFLVTPMLLHKKFHVPAEGFDFPLFAVRYAVSGTEPAEGSPICALLGREGLGAFMEVSSCGRRCCISASLGVALGAVGAVVGLGLAFALYAFGGGLTTSWLLALYAVFALPGLLASLAGAYM